MRETGLGARWSRPFVFAVVVVCAVATSVLAAWQIMGGWFGLDLPAYLGGASRLIASGSPYAAALHDGPIDHSIENIPIGYLYPPPLAQAFVPLLGVPQVALASAWSGVQVVVLGSILVAMVRRSSTLTGRFPAALALLAPLAFYPAWIGLFSGNVSGWVAIVVGASLLGGARTRGVAAVLAGFAKFTTGALVLGALADRRARAPALVFGLAIVLVSFAFAPAAWVDFVRVLPNIAAMPPAPSPTNHSPWMVVSGLGVEHLATVVRLALPMVFAILAIWHGRRKRTLESVGAAVGAYLCASTTIWDHYLIVLLPVAIAAWPIAPVWIRGLILTGIVWYGPMWVLQDEPIHRTIGVGLWLAFLGWLSTRHLRPFQRDASDG